MSNRYNQIIAIYKIVVAKIYHKALSKGRARSIEEKVGGWRIILDGVLRIRVLFAKHNSGAPGG